MLQNQDTRLENAVNLKLFSYFLEIGALKFLFAIRPHTKKIINGMKKTCLVAKSTHNGLSIFSIIYAIKRHSLKRNLFADWMDGGAGNFVLTSTSFQATSSAQCKVER